jgi:hypothetical protein
VRWNAANDDRCEHPAKIAVRPVRSDPPRRSGSPSGACTLDGDAHPVVLHGLVEHRRAGTRPAQRRRTRAHAARHDAPPGASRPAEEPPWRSRSRGSRRPHPAFLEEIPSLSRETAVGWLSSCRPPSGRSPRAAPPVALRFCHSRSSASTSCNHLSLADVTTPSGEGRRATWMASGEEPKPPTDRLDLDTVFRFADGAWPFATAGSTRVTSTPRRVRSRPEAETSVAGLRSRPVRRPRTPRWPGLDATGRSEAIRTISEPAAPRRARRCRRSEVPSTDSPGRGPGRGIVERTRTTPPSV